MRVLLLFGLPPEAPAVAVFTQQLRRTVRNDVAAPVEFFEEYLDFDRFPGRTSQLSTYFAEKYNGLRLDAVVAVGSVALRFATEWLRPWRPRIPVVFALTIDNIINIDSLPPNVTGRFSPFSFGSILSMARGLQPDARRVVIIGGLSAIDSFAVSSALRAVGEQAPALGVTLLRGLPFDSLLAELHRVPRQSIVLLAYFRRDGRGQLYIPGEIVSTISREAAAPLYGYSRLWVGEGIVGGAVIHHDEEGVNTGHLVTRVLSLWPNAALPKPVAARPPFVVDARQLKRWGLSESRLPPNTEILFRTPSVWERFRTPILASLCLITAESALIALLLLERHRRRLAQLAIADQNAYEQTIADLTTDAMRHAPEEAPRALEDALARVAQFAGASRAVLVQYADVDARPPTKLYWPYSYGASTAAWEDEVAEEEGLRIPLVEDATPIGVLELYRPNGGRAQEWSPRLVARLAAAAELIAGAMARARAARAVREGELLNRAVLASLSTQIAILDANGTIIRVNDAWRQRAFSAEVGVAHDAFLGHNYLDECLRAEERGCGEAADVRHGIESVLDRGAWHFRHEYNWSSPDVRWYELRVDRLDHEDGGAIITHIDVTDRRLAEVKAEEIRRQLTHLGRVAMVGELAAAVSHELRQPLAAIRANAEVGVQLAAKSPPDLYEITQIFRDIVDDDIRAASIIDHIRLLLRKDGQGEAPIRGTVDMNEICRQAVHLLKRDALLRRTRLELALESPLTPIAGDPIQLQQVVLNLALNALDSASGSVGDAAVTVSTMRRDGEIEIAVRDTGPGLAPDVERHLFESFFSTKEEGLGMGLSIVRSIVERHHGRVRAENDLTPGSAGGAVFRVLLPTS